jgi:hypothetical protein
MPAADKHYVNLNRPILTLEEAKHKPLNLLLILEIPQKQPQPTYFTSEWKKGSRELSQTNSHEVRCRDPKAESSSRSSDARPKPAQGTSHSRHHSLRSIGHFPRRKADIKPWSSTSIRRSTKPTQAHHSTRAKAVAASVLEGLPRS